MVRIPATVQKPSVTAETLKGLLFRDVLGECTTEVRGSAARRSNVRLAASAINGKVLNSGDVFSYNNTTGKRTTAKGYQAAPAYVQGETVNEIGGGVCQPSSTLYLACLRSNLQKVQHPAQIRLLLLGIVPPETAADLPALITRIPAEGTGRPLLQGILRQAHL